MQAFVSFGKFQWNFSRLIHTLIIVIDGWGMHCEIARRWMSLDFADDYLVNIGSGNGLEPSSNKTLPEPMLIQFYV